MPAGDAGKDPWLSGLAFTVPAGGLPGGINPVVWSGSYSSDTAGLTVQWQWGAAVYTDFSSDYNDLGVQVIDGSRQSGTPNNYTEYVIGGARGGGGSNYTGSNSARRNL